MGVAQKIIFGIQSMIFAMSCISLLGTVVWGDHMYTVGLETDTRAYFTGVTILISLPTGTKIFNCLSTYLGNPLLFRTSSALFALLFLLMFTIGGSTGVILGNAAVDLALHDTYYVVAHFHFVLSLGAVIAIFSGIIFIIEKIVGSKILLPSPSCTLSLYHFVLTLVGILLTFSPMHFLGFNVMPRRIPDFPDSFHSWNFLSSIGSGITLLSFAMLTFLSSKHFFLPISTDVQKKDTNNRPSETRNRRKTRKKIINKTSYFLFNSLNKSLNQKVDITKMKSPTKIRSKFYEK